MGTFLKIIGISSLVFVAICIVASVTSSIVSENTPLGFDNILAPRSHPFRE